jgi:antitoxin ParD1/3/4
MPVEKISIALPTDMIASLRDAVASGGYASTSEVVREALREWKARRSGSANTIAEIRGAWEAGRSSGASADLDIPAIKKRARARLERPRKKAR